MKRALLLAVAAAGLWAATSDCAPAIEFVSGRGKGAASCNGYDGSWNGAYYNPAWGIPVALVVPPTAENQTHWGWGVGNTRVTPICPQFGRNYPGPGYYNRSMFRPTPPMPSDTDQFGYYYVRGPW